MSNNSNRSTGIWWIIAIILLIVFLINGHPPKNNTPRHPSNVHTNPKPTVPH